MRATVKDIRRGDRFTWNGKTWLAVQDARPNEIMSKQLGVDFCDIALIKNRPAGTEGIVELGADLTGMETILSGKEIEIIERDVQLHHVSDDVRPETPEWQAEGILDDVVSARKTLQRALSGTDVEFRLAVQRALTSGVTVARIQEKTGLSRARIYQIRDGRR